MALNPSDCLTLADYSARTRGGRIDPVVNLLSQSLPILDDMLWLEGNLPTGHKTTIRTGLPATYWRRYNEGIPNSKSTTAQITDTCGMLEAISKIDKDLAKLNGATAEFRLSESMPFIESMGQEFSRTVFYGTEFEDVGKFTGLSARYNTLDQRVAASAGNVIDGGGRGSTNTSIWLCCWGYTTGHGIFPKGSRQGLAHEDVTTNAPVHDDQGRSFFAYQDHYKWDCGLTIRDWRYFVRIANIDVNDLTGARAANLISLLTAAGYKIPTMPRAVSSVQSANVEGGVPLSFGRPVIYCNRTIAEALDIQAQSRSNLLLTQSQFAGMPILTFRGIPVKVCDSLINFEEPVLGTGA